MIIQKTAAAIAAAVVTAAAMKVVAVEAVRVAVKLKIYLRTLEQLFLNLFLAMLKDTQTGPHPLRQVLKRTWENCPWKPTLRKCIYEQFVEHSIQRILLNALRRMSLM